MTDRNLYMAAAQYASRPKDETYQTLAALLVNAEQDRQICSEARYNLRDLAAVALEADAGRDRIQLESPKGRAELTHYSFGQLARTINAPANYLRTLPPAIAADAINYGLHDAAPVGTRANILIRDDAALPVPTIRACTSETYGRVWDADLYGNLNRWFGDGVRTNGDPSRRWQSPPVWEGGTGGNYRGDRDAFVLRIDGGSIVQDPSLRNTPGGNGNAGALYRGIMVRNSEVGHCSITIDTVLYRFICGNHILWGASFDSRFRRRHVGTKITADTITELVTIARRFNDRSASQDEQIIRTLIDHDIASTKEAVIDELRKIDKTLTKDTATQAYEMAEAREQVSPRSYWGLAQGLTRVSQQDGYQDERLALDRMAAAVLARGIKQYVTV